MTATRRPGATWAAAAFVVGAALVVGCSTGSTPERATTAGPSARPGSTDTPAGQNADEPDPDRVTTTSGASPSVPTPGTSPTTVVSTTTSVFAGDLAGKVVVLDPGHAGGNASHTTEINRLVDIGNGTKACDTTGTQTDRGYPEHEFTWDVANRVKARLEARGATVVLTRSDDTGWGPCIDERAAIGNRARATAAVSIHADGGPATGRGFHVIQPGLVPGYTDLMRGPSAQLARSLHAAYAQSTGIPPADYIGTDGFDTRTDLGGLNRSVVPKVFIECANMRNATDAALLTDPAARERMAEGIALGIGGYLLLR